MTSAKIEREQLQLQSVRDWENERTARVDAYAAVLTHLSAARDALPRGDESYGKQVRELSYSVQAARGRLSAVLQETNPFVVSADSAMRRLAHSIVERAAEHGRSDWSAQQLVECYSAVLTDERSAALARVIDEVRSA